MRNLFVFVSLVLLVACGGGDQPIEGEVPTLAATAVLDGDTVSPRATATPDSSLPPTWTPEPQASGGHLATIEPTVVVTRVIHVVQQNQTLGEIAELYGVTLDALVEANDISDIDVIDVGAQLIIP